MPATRTRLGVGEVSATGAYLTDGKKLFRVVGAEKGEVWLENCARPDEPAVAWKVKEVLARMVRRVVPSEGSRS